MDLAALGVFLLVFIIISFLVFFISVYGTKEVTFEENLKASHGDKKSNKAGQGQQDQSGKKKAKKAALKSSVSAAANEAPAEIVQPQKRFKHRKKKAQTEAKINEDIIENNNAPVETPVELVAEPETVIVGEAKSEEPKRAETPVETVVEAIVEKEPEKVEPEVVEEPKQSSAEATPKKSKKAPKSKIKIEEVETLEEEAIEPAPVEVPVAAEKKSQKVAKKKSGKQQVKEDSMILQPKLSLEDLIQTVMKTPLDDLEIQNVIDLLLTKQTGSSSSGSHYHDWIDASGENKNETKILQRQLAEKDALLSDEMAKCKSLLDKMSLLRHELNTARSNQVQSQHYVNDLEGVKKQLEARLQMENEAHQRLVANLQSQVQFHTGRNHQLQAALDNVQQPAIDPALYAELEGLRAIKADLENHKMNLEAECGSLHGRLSKQQDEHQQLLAKLNKKNNDLEEAKSSIKKLSDNLTNLEKKKSSDSGHLEEVKRANQDLDAKVKELSSKCMKQTNELSRLVEDNERLSDQLASYHERPAAEGQEANGNATTNGDHSNNIEHEDPWHKKYLAISQEHEQICKEKDVILQKMHSVESQYKSQVSKLESDLEDQRAKNNDLRSKNWKTVEALNSIEANYQKLLKSNQKASDNKVLEAALRDAEQSQKLFLQRLFPTVKTATIKSNKHNEWLEAFASEANNYMANSSSSPQDHEDKLQKLDAQVTHYKSVLAETESMLNQLQASVESEESLWKAKFSDKEATLEKLQRQLEAVEAKNAAMEASLESLNSVEEMETKLRELQEKLAVEEADKLQLQNQLHQSRESEETKRLQEQIEAEVQLRKQLDEKVAKMSQLLTTGQEALQQEKKTVDMLKQQLAAGGASEVSKIPKGSSINGQDELESSAASSQVGSVASLDLVTTPDKKKSKKKKLLGLFK